MIFGDSLLLYLRGRGRVGMMIEREIERMMEFVCIVLLVENT